MSIFLSILNNELQILQLGIKLYKDNEKSLKNFLEKKWSISADVLLLFEKVSL